TGSRAKTAQGNRNGGTNGPDPDYSHSYPPLRGRVRLSPGGIWRRDRYRWYSADHTRHLFVARARGIVIFRNYVADTPDRVVSAGPATACTSGLGRLKRILPPALTRGMLPLRRSRAARVRRVG